MAVQIGAKRDSGFDDPIGMLADCHRRIERFLHVLCVVADRAQGRALNTEESTSVQASLDYFRSGGLRHTADEEESLFPRLRAVLNDTDLAEIAALESDHQKAAQLHAETEDLYTKWMKHGSLHGGNDAKLISITSRLRQLYAEHIKIEETVVFPHAKRALDSPTIEAIGRELHARRS